MRSLWQLHTTGERYNMCEVGVASGACLLGVHSLSIFLSSLILGRIECCCVVCLVLVRDLATNLLLYLCATFPESQVMKNCSCELTRPGDTEVHTASVLLRPADPVYPRTRQRPP